MKFTVDIDKPFTSWNVDDWQNSHYAIIQVLAEKGIFYNISESVHGSFRVDFDTERQLEDKDILLMRLALGDDIRRLRMDAVRYFLNIKIDQVIK
jgi:hypothetical protein